MTDGTDWPEDGSTDTGLTVCWLAPDKHSDISVGRGRIAAHLEAAGFEIHLRGTTVRTVLEAFRDRNRYDVVLGTTRAGGIAGSAVAAAARVPLVIDHVDPIRQLRTTHGATLANLVERLENWAFRRAEHVLYVYPEEESRVRMHARSASRTDLGVDVDRFLSPDDSALSVAADELAAVDGNIAIYTGGLEPTYHVSDMITAVKHLEDWTLVVLGAGSLAERVTRAARGSDRIVFPGTVPHEAIPGYLHAADVGLSLVDDPYTVKVLEYLAAGLPVVHLAGRAERRYGELLGYTDAEPAAIADAIERVHDEDSATERVAFARRFDWEAIATDYAWAIRAVCEA